METRVEESLTYRPPSRVAWGCGCAMNAGFRGGNGSNPSNPAYHGSSFFHSHANYLCCGLSSRMQCILLALNLIPYCVTVHESLYWIAIVLDTDVGEVSEGNQGETEIE